MRSNKALQALRDMPDSDFATEDDEGATVTIATKSDPKQLAALKRVEEAVKAIVIPEHPEPAEPKDYSKQFAALSVGIGQAVNLLQALLKKPLPDSNDGAILKVLTELAATNKAILNVLKTPKELTFDDEGKANGSKLVSVN